MLFCNISSDKVYLDDGKKTMFIDRNGIDTVLGPILVDWYRSDPYDQVFVLNGPGGFTNLRVGTVVFNLLNELVPQKIDIYSCTKLKLFEYLNKIGFLPKKGLVYLGQKKNVWLYDFVSQSFDLVQIEGLGNIDDCFIDFVADNDYWGMSQEILSDKMISFGVENQKIFVQYGSKKHYLDINDLGVSPQKMIHAEYCMDPTIN